MDRSYEKIVEWLKPPDPSWNHNKALEQRHEDSGSWFLQSDGFFSWKSQPNSILWLHGIPGCGKTVLSSTIIEEVTKAFPTSPVIYFYFDFGEITKQTIDGMIRSLIDQLYKRRKNARKPLDLLFSSCEDGHIQPSTKSLCTTFQHMVVELDEIWIIHDALDECTTRKGSPTEGILSWIKNMMVSNLTNVHLLATSRLEGEIELSLREWVPNGSILSIGSDLITDDIRSYVHTRVEQDEGLSRWRKRPNVQQEIETKLMEKSDGM